MMRIVHLIFALMLLAMALIQFNDPDPVYWVTVYGLAAIIPVAHLAGRDLPALLVLTAGMVLAGVLMSVPGFIDYLNSGDYRGITGHMTGEKPYVESGREFLGLVIAAGILGFYYWRPGSAFPPTA